MLQDDIALVILLYIYIYINIYKQFIYNNHSTCIASILKILLRVKEEDKEFYIFYAFKENIIVLLYKVDEGT